VVAVIATCHALADRTAEAQAAMQHLRALDPDLRLSNLRAWISIRKAEHFALFRDGLRKAGLPE
jgi:hypothetical protein